MSQAQLATLPASHAERLELARFAQSLWTLLINQSNVTQDGLLDEAVVFDFLRHVPYTVHAWESAFHDGGFLDLAEWAQLEKPDEFALDLELWEWHQKNNARILPFGVRSSRLKAGLASAAYTHSAERKRNKEKEPPTSLVIVIFENDPNHVAFVPAGMYLAASTQVFGHEALRAPGPPHYQPFMVQREHIPLAADRLITAASGGPWYINPTTLKQITGWKPALMDAKSLDVPLAHTETSSYASLKSLFQEIRRRSGRVEFSPVAPLLYDFQCFLPVGGHLRIEHKSFDDLKDYNFMTQRESRQNPFHRHRLWHVLWIQCGGRVVCFTREAVEDQWAVEKPLRDVIPLDILQRHTFRNSSSALDHVIKHASAARAYVDLRLSTLAPEAFATGLEFEKASARIESLHHRDVDEDPNPPPLGRQESLPWVAAILMRDCRSASFGLIRNLDGGHPVGNHLFFMHCWTPEEEQYFDRFGDHPLEAHSHQLARTRCIVVDLIDYSPVEGNTHVMGGRMTMPRSQWRKGVRSMPTIVLGSFLPHELLRSATVRSSWYVLFPYEFLATQPDPELSATEKKEYYRQKVPVADRTSGDHYFARRTAETFELPGGGARYRKAQTFDKRFLKDDTVNLARYILNAADGTAYRELCRVLTSDNPIFIHNPRLTSNNKMFDPTAYHTQASLVMQAAEYGYKRPAPPTAGRTVGERDYDRSLRRGARMSRAVATTEDDVDD